MKLSFCAFLVMISCQLAFVGAIHKPAHAEAMNAEELQEERLSFAKNFANIVLAVISDNKKSFEQRQDSLEQAFSKSVDIDWIAKFVIGRAWQNADEAQRERYTELYRKFLTKTYVENFAQNPDTRISSIKVLNVKNNNETDFSVTTQMKLTNQDTMNVSYLVREDNKKYKVIDIAIENVSLITTHRAEFSKLAVSKGVAGVIAKLDELLQKPTLKPEMTLSLKMN